MFIKPKQLKTFCCLAQCCTLLLRSETKFKPETATFYNFTKFGVDVVDQIARKYTANAASPRWPFFFLYNILRFAAINAYVLYNLVTGSKISWRRYLLRLPYLKSFEQNLLKREKLITHNSPLTTVTATAVCRKPQKEALPKQKLHQQNP